MQNRRLGLSLLSALALVLTGGCGNPEEYEVVPVRGVVTCQGKPVANGFVNFTPLQGQERDPSKPGKLALGKTDSQGRFELTTYHNGDGAIVGKHVVTVSLEFNEETGQDPSARFPCRNKEIEIEVKRGMDEVKIEF